MPKAPGPVDNALWDLRGKALNQPVWKLAGGAQTRVDAYASGGYYIEGMSLAELGDEYEAHDAVAAATYVSSNVTLE